MDKGIKTDTEESNEVSGKSKVVNRNTSRVDINDLLHRVREEKNKQKKENYLFLGLVCSAVAVTGVIASL